MEIVKDQATINRLHAAAGIDPTAEVTRTEAIRQKELYKLATTVLEIGCRAMGTEVVCERCEGLALEPPMCRRLNGNATIGGA
jgi:hypothetical protein